MDLKKSQVVAIRIDEEIYKNIESVLDDETVSDFIKKAIKNELIGRDNLVSENQQILNKLDELDTTSLQEKYTKSEITLQILFEEQQKQNEILKILYIHQRVIGRIVQNMYAELSTELEKSEVMALTKEVFKIGESELKQFNFLKDGE